MIILGSRGWIGSHLQRVLNATEFDLQLGHDLLNYDLLKQVIKGHETIFHFAGIVGIKDVNANISLSQRVNVEGTLMLLEAMREINSTARLVFPSSSSIYGLQNSHLMMEDMVPSPMSIYGMQKWECEKYIEMYRRLYGIESVILRLFNPYGEGQPGHYLIEHFRQLRSLGQPLTVYGDGSTTRDMIAIEDVVSACIQASKMDLEGTFKIYNIGSGVETSVKQIAEWVGGEIRYIDNPREGLEELRKVADITRAKQYLDWQPTTFINKEVLKNGPEG